MYKGKWKGDEPTQAGPQHWIGAPRPSCTHPAPYPPPNLRHIPHAPHPPHPPCPLQQPTRNPSYSAAHCSPAFGPAQPHARTHRLRGRWLRGDARALAHPGAASPIATREELSHFLAISKQHAHGAAWVTEFPSNHSHFRISYSTVAYFAKTARADGDRRCPTRCPG